MQTNLKVILSAVGVAALLASPAIAKSGRHRTAAPPTIYLPSNAHGSVAPYGYVTPHGYGVPEGGPYTPSAPVTPGVYRDFQDGPRD